MRRIRVKVIPTNAAEVLAVFDYEGTTQNVTVVNPDLAGQLWAIQSQRGAKANAFNKAAASVQATRDTIEAEASALYQATVDKARADAEEAFKELEKARVADEDALTQAEAPVADAIFKAAEAISPIVGA